MKEYYALRTLECVEGPIDVFIVMRSNSFKSKCRLLLHIRSAYLVIFIKLKHLPFWVRLKNVLIEFFIP